MGRGELMNRIVKTVYFSKEQFEQSGHYHDCHQMIYIQKGEVAFTVNETTQIAQTGALLLFSRYEHHTVKVISDEYERYVLRISPFLTNEYAVFSLLFNRPLGPDSLLDCADCRDEVEQFFDRMVREASSGQKMSGEMLDLLVRELLIFIYRKFPERFVSFEEEGFEIVSQIQNCFENSFHEAYSLEAIAKTYGISISSLSHKFKKITGMSVMEYLRSCRIATAKRYLATTAMSISEIVEACGFSDGSNFSRIFKQTQGISPRDFRKQYAHKKRV